MLLVCVRGSSRVHGGVPWLVCRGPVQRGRRVVLDRVVVVLRVCWLCVVPRRWWVWWQGLVVVEYVMVWCGDVRYVGWVVRGAWLCWGVVGM